MVLKENLRKLLRSRRKHDEVRKAQEEQGSFSEQSNNKVSARISEGTSPAKPGFDHADCDDCEGSEESIHSSSFSFSTVNSRVHNRELFRGRFYHVWQGDRYLLPSDEHERDAMEIFHYMIFIICNEQLSYAPLRENAERILDLGTGTGTWVIESECIVFLVGLIAANSILHSGRHVSRHGGGRP